MVGEKFGGPLIWGPNKILLLGRALKFGIIIQNCPLILQQIRKIIEKFGYFQANFHFYARLAEKYEYNGQRGGSVGDRGGHRPRKLQLF